jgi:heat shock protein HslJ
MFGEENRLSGNAGCNRYSTRYALENKNQIKFQPIVSTRMACLDNDFMKQEHTFFEVMEKVRKYKIQGNQLIFMDTKGQNTLRFARLSKQAS